MVLRDYSMRLYLFVSRINGVVALIERGDGGPDTVEIKREERNGDIKRVQIKLIRRSRGEENSVGVRRIFVETAEEIEAYEKTFTEVPHVSGGELLRKWTASGTWEVTREARYIIDRVLWFEDTVEWLRDRAAHRSKFMALTKAKALAKRFGVPQDNSFRFSRRVR